MATSDLAGAASEALLAQKEAMAMSITAALYAQMPGLLEKYGESGRTKCLQDMRHNLEHLAPAVALGEPELFGRYVDWLRSMLASRGVPAEEVRRSLELTERAAREHLTPGEADLVAASIGAGLQALRVRTSG